MTNASIISSCEHLVKHLLKDAEKGHDWFHIQRVRANMRQIQAAEGGDLLQLELATILHDIDDAKFNGGDENAGARRAREILNQLSLDEPLIDKVCFLIANCSFKGGQKADNPSLELQILRDADRLDAIGAIGIARTFHYGGYKNQAIYDPAIPVREKMSTEEYRNGKSSTINHFYEKLLKLKEGMYTQTGQQIAETRHRFMEEYLKQFFEEWQS